MVTQKRRVIYMTDEEWDQVGARAARNGMTRSQLLRELVGGPPLTAAEQSLVDEARRLVKETYHDPNQPTRMEFRPVPKPSQRK